MLLSHDSESTGEFRFKMAEADPVEGKVSANGSPISSSDRHSESYSRLKLKSASSVESVILGREVFEPREKFTLYKVEVNNGERAWVVYRRYSDFVLLNKKLKRLFPNFQLNLPPKRFFKDNFSRNFIEKRQQGLEEFMRNLFALKKNLESEPVRKFFRLDNPPGPNEDLEASRTFCDSLQQSVRSLKNEIVEKDYELARLRGELAHSTADSSGFTRQNGPSYSEKVLQHRLTEAQETAKRAAEELDKMREEQRAEEALAKTTRMTERQQRELQLRDQMKEFQEKQRKEDDRIKDLVACFAERGRVQIDIGGRKIDVNTVDGVTECERDLRKALAESRETLEKLHQEQLGMYKRELEEIKVEQVRTEHQLQTSKVEAQTLRNSLEQVHARHYQDLTARDRIIQDYQKQQSEMQHYITGTEQKYFYSLVLGVKLNMAFWGRCNQAINQLKPAALFAKVRNQGVSIEHWPSWVSRELATVADTVEGEGKGW